MNAVPTSFEHSREKSVYLRITVVYMIVGFLLVIASDFLAGKIWGERFLAAEIIKGLFYILITGSLLGLVMRRYMRRLWKSREALRGSEEKFRSLFQTANDGIVIIELNEAGQYRGTLDVNEVMCKQLGYSRAELLSFQSEQFAELSEDKQMQIIELWRSLNGNDGCTFEWNVTGKDNTELQYEVSAKPFTFGRTRAFLAIFREITERKRSEQLIKRMAYSDHLTGLPNQRMLEKHFNAAVVKTNAVNRKLALLVLDIDRFRSINDAMGRTFGDQLLQHVASRIMSIVREGDVLSRMDGDDFKLLLQDIDELEDVSEFARQLSELFEEEFFIQDNEIHITVHIGVSVYPGHGEDLESLLRNANFAMYRAQENRSKFQIYDPLMNPLSDDLLIIESDLKRAVVQKQFELHYQPQVNMQSGRITGIEALIRWNHPEKGLIAPSQFIPLAEETGMIIPIGEWVLKEACRQIQIWKEAGIDPVPVSVNLSLRQFLQPNIVESVMRELREHDIPPEMLVLEITESVTMNLEKAATLLESFKQNGIKVNLDDFGTGYSSMIHLKRFPLDKLKIDKSFTRDIMSDKYDASIVSSIISLAHNLGLKVIAEGVENEDQLNFLLTHNCDEIQGYFFSPPLPSISFGDLLKQYQNSYVN
ncbi:putative bifunctional diguanylate cyclase/phosphodiesterase [Ferviditalea candida]|uniref:EAL domain-containing protein n=1 Tax=Ferviditalea candida TaxID=3108399 RepID=A0ABU5ZHC0_9BACL|nr:EAL domain-containing protein [Paenibacillaceae bacterium T2]